MEFQVVLDKVIAMEEVEEVAAAVVVERVVDPGAFLGCPQVPILEDVVAVAEAVAVVAAVAVVKLKKKRSTGLNRSLHL